MSMALEVIKLIFAVLESVSYTVIIKRQFLYIFAVFLPYLFTCYMVFLEHEAQNLTARQGF